MKKINVFLISLFAGIALVVLGKHLGGNSSNQIFFYLWQCDAGERIVRIFETPGDSLPERKLTVTEVNSKKIAYEENRGDSFCSAFPTEVEGGRLVIVWGGGSANHVEVLSGENGAVNREIEFGSRGIPELFYGGEGNEVFISVTNPIRTTFNLYMWDGKKYTKEEDIPGERKQKRIAQCCQ